MFDRCANVTSYIDKTHSLVNIRLSTAGSGTESMKINKLRLTQIKTYNAEEGSSL